MFLVGPVLKVMLKSCYVGNFGRLSVLYDTFSDFLSAVKSGTDCKSQIRYLTKIFSLYEVCKRLGNKMGLYVCTLKQFE